MEIITAHLIYTGDIPIFTFILAEKICIVFSILGTF